ncbi:BCCT family transporter [Corynebacterium otitidis]|uniref:BCCT family transporter n=1 Tax=Corynebacterium otitidis TaxID=29321 RepID=UPI0006280D06|nr:BCCT family transporter [Corynebacterium otitidis]KKO83155.1 multidrug DMT transporter permease [Corynebacterium otitidis]
MAQSDTEAANQDDEERGGGRAATLFTPATVDAAGAEVGSEERRQLKRGGEPLVVYGAVGFIVVFVSAILLFGDAVHDAITTASDWLLENFNWLYIGGTSLMLIFVLVIFVSRYGTMKLGDDDEEPEHSLVSWFCMLFAAGLGAVLMFWGVAEPINHSYNVPMGDAEPMSPEGVEEGFAFTFYHMAIHQWILFTVPGLALGYFIYKRHLPPRLSSVFAPLLGRHIYATPGRLIDVLAILGTTFGIGVSVGLGVLQINSGLNKMWGVPEVSWVQLLVIVSIAAAASLSVAAGLDKGIKVISNLNIGLAVVLMLFVFFTGPTLILVRQIVESFGIYLDWLPRMMFWSDSFNTNPGWQGKWTVFYWAWTICWSPYVGMFLARISRARSVRQYIGGALLLPAVFVVIWFSIFGRAGVEIELDNPGAITEPVVEQEDVPAALFTLLESLPLTNIMSGLAIVVIILFFVTSMDSAGLVNDMFGTGREDASPTVYRILWACLIGAVAGALLLLGGDTGIETLQQVVIIGAVPFFLMAFVMMASLFKGMHDDAAAARGVRTRKWDTADSPEKLEAYEAVTAPGYDEEGKPIQPPEIDYDAEGNLRLKGDLRVGGTIGIGDVDEDDAPETSAENDGDEGGGDASGGEPGGRG